MTLSVILPFFLAPLFVAFMILGLWLLTREPRSVQKWKLKAVPPFSVRPPIK
jgi:hypothetical protein